MCESSVYLVYDKGKEKIMDEALLIEDEGDKLVIVGILGERKEIKEAKIVKLDMNKHEVLISKK
ncbi:MAG: CooT family nickel-binding protein [Candidatus Hydrothermarchaeales archaeon]